MLYSQRLLDNLDAREHEIHVVLSNYAQQVVAEELPEGLRLPAGAKTHNIKSMNAPFASGSNPPDAMVVIPCSMGTLAGIAAGTNDDLIARAADVCLKEGRRLVLCVRDTPFSRIHLENMLRVQQAGAVVMPAIPSFYHQPKTIDDLVAQYVYRVLAQMGLPQEQMYRWEGQGKGKAREV